MVRGMATTDALGRPLTRPLRYPVQVIFFTDEGTAERLKREAVERGVSKSQVAREYLDMGIATEDEMHED